MLNEIRTRLGSSHARQVEGKGLVTGSEVEGRTVKSLVLGTGVMWLAEVLSSQPVYPSWGIELVRGECPNTEDSPECPGSLNASPVISSAKIVAHYLSPVPGHVMLAIQNAGSEKLTPRSPSSAPGLEDTTCFPLL